MTGEEIERAIEFLIASQAKHDAQIGELRDGLSELRDGLAATNNIMREQATSQSELNEMLTRAITQLAEAQQRTESKVDRLADVVERLVERE